MKNQILALISAMLPLTAAGQSTERFVSDPATVELNREPARTRTVSYPSFELAHKGGTEPSRYFQPLTEWANHTDTDGNVIFTTKYKVPFEWADRRPFLRIGAAGSGYVVIANGEIVGYNQSGRTPAEFDLTAKSNEGLNSLEIIVYKDPAARALNPAATTPTLTGETYITAQPRVRIRDHVVRPLLDGDPTAAELGVIVKSHLLNPKSVRVHYALTAPDGTPGPYGHRDADFEMKLEDTVRFFVPLPDLKAWSHETPYLYTLDLRLQYEGRYTEYISYKVGMRTVGMREGRMTVNGRPVTLGKPHILRPGDENRLNELGTNIVSVSGPVSEDLYETADRLGIYICGSADIDTSGAGGSRTLGGNPSNDTQWAAAYTDRALEMYHATKAHPSAVMFALAADGSSNGYNLYESYLAMQRVEHDRPIIYPSGGEWNDDRVEFSGNRATGGVVVTRGGGRTDTSGKRPAYVQDCTLTNGFETATLHDLVVDWRCGRMSGSEVVKGPVAAGGSLDFTINFGKNAPAGEVEFTIYRPAAAFDRPADIDKRGLVRVPVR